jgi:hypothetical protein
LAAECALAVASGAGGSEKAASSASIRAVRLARFARAASTPFRETSTPAFARAAPVGSVAAAIDWSALRV